MVCQDCITLAVKMDHIDQGPKAHTTAKFLQCVYALHQEVSRSLGG